jgi:hypothetical protein
MGTHEALEALIGPVVAALALSAEFYRVNSVPDKNHCVLGFSLGMSGGGSHRFEITGVRAEGRLMVVSALANGAPGEVLLVEEAGQLKVLEPRAA